MEFQNEMDRHQESRRQSALIVVVIQLVVSVTGFSVGLYVYLITSNLKAGSFWSHACQCFASLLFLIGLLMRHNGKGWMVSGYVFAAIGGIMLLAGAVADGVQAGHIAETDFTRCVHSGVSGRSVCGMTYNLLSLWKQACVVSYPANTCYCCYLYHKTQCSVELWGQTLTHYEGVSSCGLVENQLKPALWVSMALCIINLCVTIVAGVLVSHYKSSVPAIAPSEMVFTQSAINGRGVGGGVGQGDMTIQTRMMGHPGGDQGPVIIYTQQQTVGFYPQMIQPPAYDIPSHPPPRQLPVYSSSGTHAAVGQAVYSTPASQAPLGGATGVHSVGTENHAVAYAQTPNAPPPPYAP